MTFRELEIPEDSLVAVNMTFGSPAWQTSLINARLRRDIAASIEKLMTVREPSDPEKHAERLKAHRVVLAAIDQKLLQPQA